MSVRVIGLPESFRDKLLAYFHKKKLLDLRSFFVRVIGLEPTRLAAPDPKSGMSTNFTIPAKL